MTTPGETVYKGIFEKDDLDKLKEEVARYLNKDVAELETLSDEEKNRVRTMTLDRYNNGLLHLAAETETSSTRVTDYLLDHFHLDVNQQNKSGWVPLHNAALCSNTIMMTRLLQARPDTSIKTQKGLTVVELAIKENQVKALRVLLDWDSDFTRAEEHQVSPLLSLSAKYLRIEPTLEILGRLNSSFSLELQKKTTDEKNTLFHIAAQSYSLALGAFFDEILSQNLPLLPLKFRLNFDLWELFLSHAPSTDCLYETNARGQTPLQAMTERPVATILKYLADLQPPIINHSHLLVVPFDFHSHEDAIDVLHRIFSKTDRNLLADLIAAITILPETSMNSIQLVISHLFSRFLPSSRSV